MPATGGMDILDDRPFQISIENFESRPSSFPKKIIVTLTREAPYCVNYLEEYYKRNERVLYSVPHHRGELHAYGRSIVSDNKSRHGLGRRNREKERRLEGHDEPLPSV